MNLPIDYSKPYLNGPQPEPLPPMKGPSPWDEVHHPKPWTPLVSTGLGAGIGAIAGGQRGALKGSLYGLTMPSAISGGLWLGSRAGEAVGMPGLGGLAGAVGGGYLTHKLIQHMTKRPEDEEDEEKTAGYSSYIPGPEQKRPLKYQKNKGSVQPRGLNMVGFPDDKQIDPKLLTKAQVIAAAKKLYTDRLNGLLINEGNYKDNLDNQITKAKLDPKKKERLEQLYQQTRAGHMGLGAPHYSPITNSIGTFGDNPAVLAHELGHAADFNEDKHWIRRASRKLPYYGNLRTEYVANRNAKEILSNITDDEDRQKRIHALRRSSLYPSYGTYLGGAAGSLIGGGGLLAAALAAGTEPRAAATVGVAGSMLGGLSGALLGGWGGRALAGTVNDASWKKKEKGR